MMPIHPSIHSTNYPINYPIHQQSIQLSTSNNPSTSLIVVTTLKVKLFFGFNLSQLIQLFQLISNTSSTLARWSVGFQLSTQQSIQLSIIWAPSLCQSIPNDRIYSHWCSNTWSTFARYKECWYFVKDGQRFVREEETSESAKITANTSLDPALRAAVTDAEDGLLRPGALPQLSIASAAGNKALLDAVEKAGLGLGKAWNQKPN